MEYSVSPTKLDKGTICSIIHTDESSDFKFLHNIAYVLSSFCHICQAISNIQVAPDHILDLALGLVGCWFSLKTALTLLITFWEARMKGPCL